MTFKEFIHISEEASGTDKGLMGYPVASSTRVPSMGLPFKDFLGSVAGSKPRGPSAGAAGAGASPMGGQPMMMKKKMRKK